MTEPASWTPTPEALLSEHAWARRLARRLLRDDAAAEDVAQEACLRALEHPTGRQPRAWLAGIVRNLARERWREETRRARREALVARPESTPGAAEALERLSAQQEVVRAVLALAEPYRSTIVLRFYEDLPPRRIAARQGVPVATVKSRLVRGLADLRAKLEREHGRERALALVLLPLARVGGVLTTVLGGATLVNLLVKASLVAAAVVLVVWLLRREERAVATTAAALPDLPVPAVLVDAVSATSGRTRARREPETPAPPAPAPAALESSGMQVAGRVFGIDGEPLAGVELGLRKSNGSRLDTERMPIPENGSVLASDFGSLLWDGPHPEHEPPVAVSGPDGRFTLELEEGYWGRIVSVDPRWESVLVPTAGDIDGKEQSLIVAPRFGVSGTVVDGLGRPLAGAEVRFGVPRARLVTSGVDLEDTMAPDWGTTSDELGRFELDRLPAVPGARLRAQLRPYESRLIARELWSDDVVELRLVRAPGAWLEGVVEAGSAPLAGAVVALGTSATTTDAEGRFQVHLAGREGEVELCAAAKGFAPARLCGERDASGAVRWPELVRIELSGEPLALAGTVVDAEGRPLAGHEVWLGQGRAVLHDEGQFPFLLESVLADQRDSRLIAKSDEHGAFVLEGLDERGYELIVVDPRTALVSHAGPFPAGRRDLRLVQPTDRVWPLVRGVVVSGSGEPLADVDLHVEQDVDFVGTAGSVYFGFNAEGAKAETDAEGAFELRDVPRGARITSFRMDLVDPQFVLEAEADPLAVRIVAERWVRLEVRAAGVPEAASFAVLDGDGRALQMEVAQSGGTTRLYSADLVDGASPVVKVSERGATLVVYGAQRVELARVPVTLATGELNRVEL